MVLPIPASTVPRSRLLLESCGTVVDSFGSDTLGSEFPRCQSRTFDLGETDLGGPSIAVGVTLVRAFETFARRRRSLHCGHDECPPSTRRRPAQTTIADIAAQAGVSVPTVSKVINGRSDVLRGDATARRGRPSASRLPANPARRSGSPDPRADLPRARQRVGARDRPGRRARRRRHHLPSSSRRCRAAGRPGRGWIESVLARRPTGVIAVFSDLSETMRHQLADARASRS